MNNTNQGTQGTINHPPDGVSDHPTVPEEPSYQVEMH